MKVLILNTKKANFTNKDTGEVVEYTTTQICSMVEPTDTFCGYVVEEITGKVGDFDIIKNYVNKMVDIDIEYKRVDRKNYRVKILKIGDTVL